MITYAFKDDGSEYARSLLQGIDLLGVEAFALTSPGELESTGIEGLSAVVLVNPSPQFTRDVRASMDKTAGWMAQVPLVVAMDSMDRLVTVALRVADDFLVSPAGAGELISRIKVITLRRGGDGEVISFGELVINLDAHQVLLNGKPVDLTFKEFELLRTLASTPGRVYSREELLKSIWGYDYFGGTRTVDVHVRRLRAKIEGTRRYVETVHSVGYRFTAT